MIGFRTTRSASSAGRGKMRRRRRRRVPADRTPGFVTRAGSIAGAVSLSLLLMMMLLTPPRVAALLPSAARVSGSVPSAATTTVVRRAIVGFRSVDVDRRRHPPPPPPPRPSIRLFGSGSFPETEAESSSAAAAVISGAPESEDAESSSSSSSNEKDNVVGENDEKDPPSMMMMMMNPMESFAVDAAVAETLDGGVSDGGDGEYERGLLTIGFITLLFATNSPVLHWAFTSGDNPPPVLLVNTAVSVVALVGLLLGGDTLEETGGGSGSLPGGGSSGEGGIPGWVGGLELGLWKFLGTTANLAGLALTTASHGALLIQLTTLIVPATRAIAYGESISNRLKLSIGLALSGVVCFANDPTGTPSLLGDGLCVGAAVCYSAYDLRLYEYGKVVDAVKPLITTKIATQALLSTGLLYLAPSSLLSGETTATTTAWQESSDYWQALFASTEWPAVVAAVLWSGVAVNAVAPFLQVSGQQIVGPTKCQTIYASQPLWAATLSFAFLGERVGWSGAVGGTAFLAALALAASANDAEAGGAAPASESAKETT